MKNNKNQKINIYETIEKIRNNKPTGLDENIEKLISDCFKYEIFVDEPDKYYIKWFNLFHDTAYPEPYLVLDDDSIGELLDDVMEKKEHQKRRKLWDKQLLEKGYCDMDVDEMYLWFLKVVPNMLTEFVDNIDFLPEKYYQNLDNAFDEKEEEKAINKWKNEINKMIFLLNKMKLDSYNIYISENELQSTTKKFFDLFAKNFWYLWNNN